MRDFGPQKLSPLNSLLLTQLYQNFCKQILPPSYLTKKHGQPTCLKCTASVFLFHHRKNLASEPFPLLWCDGSWRSSCQFRCHFRHLHTDHPTLGVCKLTSSITPNRPNRAVMADTDPPEHNTIGCSKLSNLLT